MAIVDGEPLPEAIIIQIPGSVLRDLTNQYAATGLADSIIPDATLGSGGENNPARRAAINHINRVIAKYIPAGTPYIVIDETGISRVSIEYT